MADVRLPRPSEKGRDTSEWENTGQIHSGGDITAAHY